MFDRIVEVLIHCFEWFIPFAVVDEFERGVLLRWGRFSRELDPGFHFIWPFGIDKAFIDNVVPRTIKLQAQSLTTQDGRSIVVGAVVTAQIRDIVKATLEVEHVDHVLEDSCYGQLGNLVAITNWADMHTEEFCDRLTANCRKNAFKFGVEIMRVQISDNSVSRAIRLYQTAAPL